MTLRELIDSLREANEGLAYTMWKQGVITMSMLGKKAPKSPQEASPELYPPKKTYKMSEWMKEKYYKQKGVEIVEQ